MKTYLRYSIRPKINPRTNSEIPEDAKQEAVQLFEQCRQYCINEQLKLVLVPIDTKCYEDIMVYINRYYEWASGLIMYEHKYSKEEMDNAEYYRLKVNSFLPTKSQDLRSMYSFCCDKGKMINEQIGNMKLSLRDIEKKGISFTGSYRFLVTIAIKETLEVKNISNIKFIPSYDKLGKNIVAYQIEAQEFLPSLEPYNNWGVYKKCNFCGKTIFNPQHQNITPFLFPISYKDKLKDFNATFEQFPQSSREYIISKKLYNVLLSYGARKLACEPILFI